jgi:hypothetical protein
MKVIMSSLAMLGIIFSSGCKSTSANLDGASDVKSGLFRSESILAGEGAGWCPKVDAQGQSLNLYIPNSRGPAIRIGTMGAEGEEIPGTPGAFRIPTFRFVDGKLSALLDPDRREIYSQVFFAENGIRSTLKQHNEMEFKIDYSQLDCKSQAVCKKVLTAAHSSAPQDGRTKTDIETQSTDKFLVNVRRVATGSPAYLRLQGGAKPSERVTIFGLNGIGTDVNADSPDGLHFRLGGQPLYVKVLDRADVPLYSDKNPNQTFAACLN